MLSSENLSDREQMRAGVADEDCQGPHTCSGRHRRTQTDPTVGKGEWKQICHSFCCLHRSCAIMCKNSPLPPFVAHKHSSKTLTHPHHSFKGCLRSLASLGRVEGFVCFSVCGQDVASTSRSSWFTNNTHGGWTLTLSTYYKSEWVDHTAQYRKLFSHSLILFTLIQSHSRSVCRPWWFIDCFLPS